MKQLLPILGIPQYRYCDVIDDDIDDTWFEGQCIEEDDDEEDEDDDEGVGASFVHYRQIVFIPCLLPVNSVSFTYRILCIRRLICPTFPFSDSGIFAGLIVSIIGGGVVVGGSAFLNIVLCRSRYPNNTVRLHK